MHPGSAASEHTDPDRSVPDRSAPGTADAGTLDPDSAGPGVVDLDDLIGDLRRVLLVSSRMLRTHTASDEISPSQFSVLAYLHRAGQSTPGRVADFEKVSPPVMTRILARLQAAGMVEREPHPDDGRQVVVRVTSRGAEHVERGRRARDAWLRGRLEDLDDDGRRDLVEATSVLHRTLLDQRVTRGERPA